MSPGMGYYLIKFKFEGFWYFWDDRIDGYFNFTTQRVFKKPPIGAMWDESCFISGWNYDPDDEEEKY